ncbi:MAG: hypothetical protein PHY45_11840 [Rhodocyclaceae bacterium]|nr:hypothetical protein [Rhodocyclaceae bacterium]
MHDSTSKDWIKTAVLLLVLLLAYGAAGRMEFDDARTGEEAARQARELVMAAQWCGPKPGQRSVQEWRDGRLHCEIYEHTGYGRTKRIVAQLDAPALSYPLGNEGE